MTNPASSAIVNVAGAMVHGEDRIQRRYLVNAQGSAAKLGLVVWLQVNDQERESGAMTKRAGAASR